MSLTDKDLALTRRATIFAKVAFVVSILAAALAIWRCCYSYWAWIDRGSVDLWGLQSTTKWIIALVFDNGLTDAFFIFGAGLVALAAVKVASAPMPPYWAVAMDDSFAAKARRFATAAQVFAWVYALYVLANGLQTTYRSARDYGEWPDFGQVNVAISAASYALRTFFTFILAAMIIRVLIVIASNAPSEVRPSDQRTEGGQS